MGNVVTVDQRPNLSVGVRPSAIVPQTMDEAYRLGKAICMAGMAPKGMETPEKCMIAIMRGMEVGFTPMMALDKIAVVNGRPTIWGDGAIGLVRGSGLCEWVKERMDGAGDARKAVCEAKRLGEPEAIIREFSVADAKKAHLWGKQGPWQQFPDRMLQMRARAFALRDGFADVLGGLYLKEEVDDAPEPRRAAPAVLEPPIPPETPMIEASATTPPAPPVEPPIPPFPPEPETDAAPAFPLAEKLREACMESVERGDAAGIDDAWARIVAPHEASLSKEQYEELSAIANGASRMLAP